MEFFSSAVTVLQTLVVAIGAGLGVWGIVNLLEGYGNDNRRRRCPDRHYPRSSAERTVRLISNLKKLPSPTNRRGQHSSQSGC